MSSGPRKTRSEVQVADDPKSETSSVRMSGPDPDEHLVAHLRAGIKCAEQCPSLLTCDEAARVLRIGPDDVEKLIATRQLVSVIIAGQELVPVRELVDLIADYAAISKRSKI